MQPYDSFDFTYNGDEFTANLYYDDYTDPPWEAYDGHGEVDWIRDYDAIPRGWRVIYDSHHGRYIYNVSAAILKAAKEGWSTGEGSRSKRRYAAVKEDIAYLVGYLRKDWCYCGVSVVRKGEEDDFLHALWGIESDCEDYIRDVAEDLAHDRMGSNQG